MEKMELTDTQYNTGTVQKTRTHTKRGSRQKWGNAHWHCYI